MSEDRKVEAPNFVHALNKEKRRNVMKQNYEFILTSYPDSEDFAVEIWLKDDLIASVMENSSLQQFEVQVYQNTIDSDVLNEIINRAKEMLAK
ncbi:MAG: hypothetical protein HFH91_02710 [Lachnospiraceae bacterium]|nr:hypothetical protein [Lachnospiraceae bacterium]